MIQICAPGTLWPIFQLTNIKLNYVASLPKKYFKLVLARGRYYIILSASIICRLYNIFPVKPKPKGREKYCPSTSAAKQSSKDSNRILWNWAVPVWRIYHLPFYRREENGRILIRSDLLITRGIWISNSIFLTVKLNLCWKSV